MAKTLFYLLLLILHSLCIAQRAPRYLSVFTIVRLVDHHHHLGMAMGLWEYVVHVDHMHIRKYAHAKLCTNR